MLGTVGGQDDGQALVPQRGEQFQNHRLIAQVECRYRLVEDEGVAPGGQCTGDEDQLLLAAGQAGERPRCQMGHAHPVQGLGGDPAVLGARLGKHAQLPCPAHEDHVGYEVREDSGRRLRHEADLAPAGHRTLRRFGDPGQQPQQRRLADAVGTEQRRDGRRFHRHVEPPEHPRATAEAKAEISGFNHGIFP